MIYRVQVWTPGRRQRVVLEVFHVEAASVHDAVWYGNMKSKYKGRCVTARPLIFLNLWRALRQIVGKDTK